jgi:ribosome-binding factor A
MSGFKRAERVAVEILRALSEIIRSVKDPRVGPLSITNISVTDDLRLARIRVVPLGGEGDRGQLLEGLRAASGFLSRKLAKKVRMKYAPRLEFHIDEQIDQAFSLVEQLESLVENDEESSSEDRSSEEE